MLGVWLRVCEARKSVKLFAPPEEKDDVPVAEVVVCEFVVVGVGAGTGRVGVAVARAVVVDRDVVIRAEDCEREVDVPGLVAMMSAKDVAAGLLVELEA